MSYVLQTSAHFVRPFGACVRHRKRRSLHVSCSVTYEMPFYLGYDFGKIIICWSVSYLFSDCGLECQVGSIVCGGTDNYCVVLCHSLPQPLKERFARTSTDSSPCEAKGFHRGRSSGILCRVDW